MVKARKPHNKILYRKKSLKSCVIDHNFIPDRQASKAPRVGFAETKTNNDEKIFLFYWQGRQEPLRWGNS